MQCLLLLSIPHYEMQFKIYLASNTNSGPSIHYPLILLLIKFKHLFQAHSE